MNGETRVGLMFGGYSVEHEVSVVSARGVARAMQDSQLTCVPLAVTTSGRWLGPEPSRRILDGDVPRVEEPTGADLARLVVEPAGKRLLLVAGDRPAQPVEVDVVFPLIHGWGGEDGRLQGALELAGIPCVGAGVLGSAAGMDKALSRVLFEAAGLPVCPWLALRHHAYRAQPDEARRRVLDELGLPLFVKPSNGGSSLGVSKVNEPDALRAALELGFEHDPAEVVVEQAVYAREIECAVLGNDDPEASGLGEIVPSREFYDYAAKYLDGTSELKIPAPLEAAQERQIRRMAVEAFRALRLRGFARVDFLVERGSGRVYLNEANTLPGFTPISMFPKLWEAEGLPYSALIERLVALATSP